MRQGLRKHRAAGYKFRRQHSLGPFIVDFYLPEWNLAVEVDGATHDVPHTKEYDGRRTEFLRANGIEVIRFTDGEVLWSVDMCVEKILKKIEEMNIGHNLPPTPSLERKESLNPPPFQGGG